MSNMRPFASTPAARTKDTVIWSFNGQNCSFYNLNWINVHRSQKNGPMRLFIQNVFYTCKWQTISKCKKHSEQRKHTLPGMSNMRPAGRMSCVADMTTQMWPIGPSGDSRFDMPGLDGQGIESRAGRDFSRTSRLAGAWCWPPTPF
jgi:hypothetical protein